MYRLPCEAHAAWLTKPGSPHPELRSVYIHVHASRFRWKRSGAGQAKGVGSGARRGFKPSSVSLSLALLPPGKTTALGAFLSCDGELQNGTSSQGHVSIDRSQYLQQTQEGNGPGNATCRIVLGQMFAVHLLGFLSCKARSLLKEEILSRLILYLKCLLQGIADNKLQELVILIVILICEKVQNKTS